MRDPSGAQPSGSGQPPATMGPAVDAADAAPAPGVDASIDQAAGGQCRPASITLVIDGSGSMCQLFGDSSRWLAVRAALVDAQDGLVHRLQSRAEIGIDVFDGSQDVLLLSSTVGTPSPACAAMYLSTTADIECPRLIEVQPAPDNAAAIEAALPMNEPGGSSPTDKVISTVVERVIQNGLGPTPGRAHAIVLITDGVPSDVCLGGKGGDGSVQRSAVIASVDRAAASGVATYVVNMSPNDVALDLFTTELAQHGAPSDPTAGAYKPADENTLRGALEEIAAEVLGCPL